MASNVAVSTLVATPTTKDAQSIRTRMDVDGEHAEEGAPSSTSSSSAVAVSSASNFAAMVRQRQQEVLKTAGTHSDDHDDAVSAVSSFMAGNSGGDGLFSLALRNHRNKLVDTWEEEEEEKEKDTDKDKEEDEENDSQRTGTTVQEEEDDSTSTSASLSSSVSGTVVDDDNDAAVGSSTATVRHDDDESGSSGRVVNDDDADNQVRNTQHESRITTLSSTTNSGANQTVRNHKRDDGENDENKEEEEEEERSAISSIGSSSTSTSRTTTNSRGNTQPHHDVVEASIENVNKTEALLAKEMHPIIVEEELGDHPQSTTTTTNVLHMDSDSLILLLKKDTNTTSCMTMSAENNTSNNDIDNENENNDTDLFSDIDDKEQDQKVLENKMEVVLPMTVAMTNDEEQDGGKGKIDDSDDNGLNEQSNVITESSVDFVANSQTNVDEKSNGDDADCAKNEVAVAVTVAVVEMDLDNQLECLPSSRRNFNPSQLVVAAVEAAVVGEATHRVEDHQAKSESPSITTVVIHNDEIIDDIGDEKEENNIANDEILVQVQVEPIQDVTEEEKDVKESTVAATSTAKVNDAEGLSSCNIQQEIVAEVGTTTTMPRDTGRISTDTDIATSTKKAGTSVMSFAERMKKMFDSSSPDEPSMAFGNNMTSIEDDNTNADPVSDTSVVLPNTPLAERMKKMLDLTSPDEPSVAFGKNKDGMSTDSIPKPVLSISPDDDDPQKSSNVDGKYDNISCGNNTKKEESSGMKKDGDDSNVIHNNDQLAHQMVSLLWASSSSSKAKAKNNTLPTSATAATNDAESLGDGNDGNDDRDHHTIEEVTITSFADDAIPVKDEEAEILEVEVEVEDNDRTIIGGHDASDIFDNDDDFSVEEVTVIDDDYIDDEDNHNDDMTVTTVGDLFENTACVEISSNFINTDKNSDDNHNDGQSYGEFTADDWEYDENTVDDNELFDGDGDDDDDNDMAGVVTKDYYREEKSVDAETDASVDIPVENAQVVSIIISDSTEITAVGTQEDNNNLSEKSDINISSKKTKFIVDSVKNIDDTIKKKFPEEVVSSSTKTTTMVIDYATTAAATNNSTNNPVKGAPDTRQNIPIITSTPTSAPAQRGKLADRLKMFESPRSNDIPSAFLSLGRSFSTKENFSSIVTKEKEYSRRPSVIDTPFVNGVPKNDVTCQPLKPVMKPYVAKESKRDTPKKKPNMKISIATESKQEAPKENPVIKHYVTTVSKREVSKEMTHGARTDKIKPSVGIKLVDPPSSTGTTEITANKDPSTSALIDEELLVDQILALLNEPRCMENKNILAQRIASLLLVSSSTNNGSFDGEDDGKNNSTPEAPAYSPTMTIGADPSIDSLDMTTHSSHHNRCHDGVVGVTKNSPTMTMLRKKLVTRTVHEETNAYIVRKNDGFKDQGLRKWRNDTVAHRESLRQCHDPDSLSVRRMKRVSISELKQEKEDEEKREQKQEDHQRQQRDNSSSIPPPFTCRQLTSTLTVATSPPLSPPSVVDNSVPENHTVPSRCDQGPPQLLPLLAAPVATIDEISVNSSKNDTMLAEQMIAKIWPKDKPQKPTQLRNHEKKAIVKTPPSANKLGDRLKMFNSPPAAPSSSLSASSSLPYPRSRRVSFSGSPTTKEVPKMFVSGVSENTLKRLSSFQRLWRKTRKATEMTDIVATATVTNNEGSCAPATPYLPPPPPPPPSSAIPIVLSTLTSTSTNEKKLPSSPVGVSTESGGDEMNDGGLYYTLDDFEQKRVDSDTIDMRKWEWYLNDEEFRSKFGSMKNEFYQQPKWKQEKQKRKIRVSF